MNTLKWINRKTSKDHRRYLRKHSTPAEKSLWKLLKNHQVEQLKFRRQQSIGNYIVDFYCPEIRLAIELDGQVHISNKAYDDQRTLFIEEKMSIHILRYENRFVFEHPDCILADIKEVWNKYL